MKEGGKEGRREGREEERKRKEGREEGRKEEGRKEEEERKEERKRKEGPFVLFLVPHVLLMSSYFPLSACSSSKTQDKHEQTPDKDKHGQTSTDKKFPSIPPREKEASPPPRNTCDLQMLVAAAEGRLADLKKSLATNSARIDGADVS